MHARRQPKPAALPRLLPMTLADVEAVHAIEASAYTFPWTRGNFLDSLVAGHLAEVLRADDGGLLGYFIALPGPGEMHLLNLAVAPAQQRRGHASRMLHALVRRSLRLGAQALWLEVRESNRGAQALYLGFGFLHVGRRRAYYPEHGGRREDALLMSLDLNPYEGRDDGLD